MDAEHDLGIQGPCRRIRPERLASISLDARISVGLQVWTLTPPKRPGLDAKDLSGDVPVSTKEKIGLITLRSVGPLVCGSKTLMVFEVFPAISDVFVQPPEPIVEQVAQPVIPPEVPSADAQLPASSSLPEQDAPSEMVHDVLRDLRGKGILSEDVPVSPTEHIFEEREPSYSPSQFETQPRSQGESSNSLNTILELVRTQQENLSVLHMQVEVIDVKFDSLADEVK
ncbi:hypothetical protein Taro_049128 [Colocasia esculenta]|uniref:Uncharacterized protein n=1 Tax=Colocasia esculenta TaxID=4460 RepID=A0A843X9Y2_COLES|nr:hypothetical protein [Colocasia esculenta]